MKRVAVIGGGIGGLTAAGVLARQGHRVTLFEATDALGGKAGSVRVGGLTFDTGPTVMTMPDTVRATFAELGAEDLMPRLLRVPLQTRYRWPDGRVFDCWESLEQAAEGAEALEPGGGRALRAFFREAEVVYRAAGQPYLEAPYETMMGFMARAARNGLSTLVTGLKLSTLDALARAHFRGPHLRQFVGRFATYAGASPYEANAAFAMIAHIERAFGVHHAVGGLGGIVRGLEQAARRNGVEVVLGRKATQSMRGAEFIVDERAFDAVVVNADPLQHEGRADQPLTMSGYVAMFEAPARLALPHHTILFTADYAREFDALGRGRVADELTVHLCHPAATDETMAPAGRSGLYAMVNVPPMPEGEEARWPEHARRLEGFIRQRAGEMAPELEGVTLTAVAERTPVDLQQKGAPRGSIYGYLPHGRFGPFRRPAIRGAVPGLFFAGGGTHPGGGVPLVMLSGRFAAGLAAAHLGGRS
ncbi:MAG: phytoene desaturase [Myxococcaceae bacterium]|jgi:1-hydroxycarotenoid 3,4-desaturase|nr:phytoene desaturase [Myxococcaceae bacterium]MCA3016275.1 phytoene desaturase [Myxococcaceae bacterium]